MIDNRITKLLKRYYACRQQEKSQAIDILEKSYDTCFAEIKYQYESIMTLSSLDYHSEHNRYLEKIEENEEKLIRILIELISLSE